MLLFPDVGFFMADAVFLLLLLSDGRGRCIVYLFARLFFFNRALDRVQGSAETERNRRTVDGVTGLWSVKVVNELGGVVPRLLAQKQAIKTHKR